MVVVFGRVPRLGIGKRRLARSLGDRAALRASRNMLAGIQRTLRSLRGINRILAMTPDDHARYVAPGFHRIGQGSGDLGARMQRILRRYPRRPVLIVGSDIPDIAASDIRDAIRCLRGASIVFGPAYDGGYWLIGLSGPRPGTPFNAVRWSTAHALADTQRNFPRRRIALLRTLADVDSATNRRLTPADTSSFARCSPRRRANSAA